ncbi:MAG: gliding motility lipoprotein GldH [Flavobacteriaceae bacterium]|nr:gliding motility lipoprotein GldH [Flavobacteriaceae bacterium]
MQYPKIKSFIGKIILFFIVIISIGSCTKNMVFDKYQSIDQVKWHKDSIVNFTINSLDTLSKNNIYINLRNNKDYEFSNLFLIVSIKFPNNYQIVDTLEYEMTTLEGRFLGTGITDIKENKMEYKTSVNFPIQGDYEISIQQAMRKTRSVDGLIYLHGITDVGLQIEKVN